MSLLRQLVILFSLILLCVFGLNFSNNLKSHREYLRLQLNSHAQDATTTLGLALKPYLESNDIATMYSIVDVIFDGGYYQSIVLTDNEGKGILKRSVPLKIMNTPAWFIAAFPLQNNPASAEITTNWSHSAVIEVTSHPGFVYATFWNNVKRELLWGTTGLLIATLLLWVLLRQLLKPLTAVENQAHNICQQNFVRLDIQPKTREFLNIVTVMNQLSSTVEQTINRSTSYASHMREEAYCDPESGLYNHSRFERILEKVLSTGASGSGVLLAIKLDLRHHKQSQLVKSLVTVVEQQGADYFGNINARWQDDVFIMLLPNVDTTEIELLANAIIDNIEQAVPHSNEYLAIGITRFTPGDSHRTILQSVTESLDNAQKQETDEPFWMDQNSQVAVTSALGYLEKHSLILMAQSIATSQSENCWYKEVLARVKTETGDYISAKLLLSQAKKQGTVWQCDRLILQSVFEHIEHSQSDTCFGINLDLESLMDNNFWIWFIGALAKRRGITQRLIFELSINDVQQHIEQARSLIGKAQLLGCQIALEHVGMGTNNINLLKQLKPHIIKIDGSYVRGIADDRDNQFFVHSLTSIAHSLQIKVIAESTERIEDYLVLQTLKVDAFQGHLIDQPSLLA